MKSCGVLFTTLLASFVVANDSYPSIPLVRRSNLRTRRQTAGVDPNLEGIFGQQNGNANPSHFGHSSSSSNERPPFGFGFSGLEQASSNHNGGSHFENFGNHQNQGSTGNGEFENVGINQGTLGNSVLGNQGGDQGSSGNNRKPSGGGMNSAGVQRPQTTQRAPLNQIALQTTINDGDCLRGCRNKLPQQYSPVCGSDNISYSNRQVFDCYKRECRQDVTVVYSGSCVTTRVPN